MPHLTRPRPLFFLLLFLSLTSPSWAQGSSQGEPTPTFTEFESEPIRIDALNLTIQLPVGAVSETTSFGNNSSVGIGFPDKVGVMVIKEQRTSNTELSLEQVTQSIIKQLTRYGNSITGTVLSHDKELSVNGVEGQRFYVQVPGLKNKPNTVRGMTIFESKPQHFIIFDLTTLERDFDRCKVMYENTIGTMHIDDSTSDAVKRAAAIKAMLGFIDQRGLEDIQKVTTGKTTDRWERLYLPASTGDDMDASEYGYRRVRSWTGFKGDLTDKPKSKWNDDDRQLGYLVQIDAMALEDEIRVDTRATFYTSVDNEEESWTIKMSLRQGEEQTTSTITGARSKKDLVVLTDSSNASPIKTTPLIQGEGYISQAMSYLLSPLLASYAQPGDYASYVYTSSAGAITLRWDKVEHPEDSPGLIRVTTRPSSDTPPTVGLYTKDGSLMRVRLSNGRIWEPIELDRLIALWKKKGLPLD
ncbi:MAG: hypothetical protein R3B67_05340 [Phycisphaerales bacterium]